ncbi:MAG: nucleotidyltransferase family protein [Erysipelotrichia bacterium]|nr:nucleotidyltransferase family protein [Erysipelotrichia bacterium]
MFGFNTDEGYFLHLLKCGLKTEKPKEPPVGIDFESILELAIKQDVENIVFLSVDQLNNKPSGELYDNWREFYYKRQKHCLFQDMVLEELIVAFTKAGIDCMPLKGSVIKNYYPNPDLRCMGDVDFLVKEQNRQIVRDIMYSLGYQDDILDDGQVDGFKRGKLEYVEIHYDFSAENHIYHEIFTIDWNKLVPTETEHLYQMTLEDLYFFNVGHYVKNMYNKGMGIRGIIDSYVLWNILSESERNSVAARLGAVGLDDFNSKMLKIAYVWFDNEEDDDNLSEIQNYLINRETYGDERTAEVLYTMHKFDTKSKLNFLIRKIFPTADELYCRFKIKKRMFILLPFLWFARLFALLFGNKSKWENAKGQIEKFDSVDQSAIDYERKVRQEFGLM